MCPAKRIFPVVGGCLSPEIKRRKLSPIGVTLRPGRAEDLYNPAE